jgi:hypothetical protein
LAAVHDAALLAIEKLDPWEGEDDLAVMAADEWMSFFFLRQKIIELVRENEAELRAFLYPVPALEKWLTPEGRAAWIDFYNAHANEQAELTGDLAAASSKLEGYTARLAQVVHFVRWAAGDSTLRNADEVDEQSIGAGVELSRWFGHEARRVYAMLGESEEDRGRRQLVELLRRVGGSATIRELMRSSRMFKKAEDVELALVGLAEAGLGRWEHDDHHGGRGRPVHGLQAGHFSHRQQLRLFRAADGDRALGDSRVPRRREDQLGPGEPEGHQLPEGQRVRPAREPQGLGTVDRSPCK